MTLEQLSEYKAKVDAGLAASIFHYGELSIRDLKAEMAANGIPTRL